MRSVILGPGRLGHIRDLRVKTPTPKKPPWLLKCARYCYKKQLLTSEIPLALTLSYQPRMNTSTESPSRRRKGKNMRLFCKSTQSSSYEMSNHNIRSEAKGALEGIQARSKNGAKFGSFQNVLERLLRLRQMCVLGQTMGLGLANTFPRCNHWTLCKERIIDLLKTLEDQDVVVLNDRNREILQQALRLFIENQEECPVCIDTLDAPLITRCKHVFCGECIRKVVQTQGKCPMCRTLLSEDHLLEAAPETSGEEVGQLDSETQSSKTEAMLKILQATLMNPGSKVIIFSQW